MNYVLSDPLQPYRIEVNAMICDRTYELFNDTVVIQRGVCISVDACAHACTCVIMVHNFLSPYTVAETTDPSDPSLIKVVRTSPTSASFGYLLGARLSEDARVEITYYINTDNSFDEVCHGTV